MLTYMYPEWDTNHVVKGSLESLSPKVVLQNCSTMNKSLYNLYSHLYMCECCDTHFYIVWLYLTDLQVAVTC